MKQVRFSVYALTSSALFSAVALAQTSEPVRTTAAAPNGQAGAPQWTSWLFLGGMVVLMYFFLIRPQSKRQKEHKKFLDALQVGQEVLTQGGIIGKVVTVADQIVTLDIGANSTIKVLKSSISGELGKTSFVDSSVTPK